MSVGENQTDPNEIDLEALRWLALMERGPLGPQEQRLFAVWVAADIRHQGAMIRAQAASLRLDRLAALAGGRSLLEPLPHEQSLLQKNTTRRRMMAAAASAALTQMNRYSHSRIVVDDPELGERRIVGVFSTADTQTFVSAMTATLGVEAVGRDDVVLLRSVN